MKQISILLALFVITFSAEAQHSIILKDGTKETGVVLELKNDILTCMVGKELKTYQMVDISSLFFNEYVPYDGSYDPTEPEKTIKSGNYTLTYQMKDRKMVQAPPISNGTENKGVVVVEIEIDRYGNVLKAKSGASGSTTSNEYLYIKAEYAAKSARFDKTTVGPVITTGTITISY